MPKQANVWYSAKQPKPKLEEYVIYKWEGTDFDEPENAYQIAEFTGPLVCTCPAAIHRRGNCKHLKILSVLKKNRCINLPIYYNPETGKWIDHNIDLTEYEP